jgi:hypothetical protein
VIQTSWLGHRWPSPCRALRQHFTWSLGPLKTAASAMVCMLHGEAAWRRSGHRLTVVAFLLSLLMRLSNTLLLAQCSIRAFTGMCVHPHLP